MLYYALLKELPLYIVAHVLSDVTHKKRFMTMLLC